MASPVLNYVECMFMLCDCVPEIKKTKIISKIALFSIPPKTPKPKRFSAKTLPSR